MVFFEFFKMFGKFIEGFVFVVLVRDVCVEFVKFIELMFNFFGWSFYVRVDVV